MYLFSLIIFTQLSFSSYSLPSRLYKLIYIDTYKMHATMTRTSKSAKRSATSIKAIDKREKWEYIDDRYVYQKSQIFFPILPDDSCQELLLKS